MLEREPTVIVLGLVENDWDETNTPLANAPRFHTGWYDYASSDPQVTFTNAEESTVDGGVTGITASTGDGGISQVRAGTILVNCWAGTREDMENKGVGGTDVNPKAAAYQMAREAHRILNENAAGTTNPSSGDQELHSLAAGPARKLVDTERASAVFRYEVTARYVYVENTTA